MQQDTISVEERLAQLEQGISFVQKENLELLKKLETTPAAEIRLAQLEQGMLILQEENKALRSELAAVPAVTDAVPKTPKIPEKTFKVGGTEYKFVVPQFRNGKEIITAVDALTDKELLAELVAKGSGVIREIE